MLRRSSARSGLLSPVADLVDGCPSAPLGLSLRNAAFLVRLFDVFCLSLLFVRVLVFVSPWHCDTPWTVWPHTQGTSPSRSRRRSALMLEAYARLGGAVGAFVAPRVVVELAVDEVEQPRVVAFELDPIADLVVNAVRRARASGAVEVHLHALRPILVPVRGGVGLLPKPFRHRLVISLAQVGAELGVGPAEHDARQRVGELVDVDALAPVPVVRELEDVLLAPSCSNPCSGRSSGSNTRAGRFGPRRRR